MMCGVAAEPHEADDRVRTAELISALCLATDLGMGFPLEHGLQTTLIAMRIVDRLGLDRQTAVETYYASLLSHAGCTSTAHVAADVFGGSLTTSFNPLMYGSPRQVLTGLLRALPDPGSPPVGRVLQTARRFPRMAREERPALTAGCEVAGMLADRFGAPASVPGLLAHLTERWDGKGPLRRAKVEQIPLPMRIVHVAVDAAFQRLLGGSDHAARLVRERAGHAFDPEIAAVVADGSAQVLAVDDVASTSDAALAVEPGPPLVLEADTLDRAMAAAGSFADLVSPYLTGHSTGVAELAAAAVEHCGADAGDTTAVRRAGLVHDLGRVAVHPRIWQQTRPLTGTEWEEVRLHPYHTDRVLSRSSFLATLSPIAEAHHERLDGSGYYRRATAPELSFPARVLAAADAYHAMTEPRPHRPPLTAGRAAQILSE